jgi:sugar lactone lactonase YvrE
VAAGTEPHHFGFTPGRVWASDNGGGTVVRIDARSRRILGRTRVGPAPHHIAAVGRGVLVAVHGRGAVAALSPRGRLQRLIDVGAGPHGMAAVRQR